MSCITGLSLHNTVTAPRCQLLDAEASEIDLSQVGLEQKDLPLSRIFPIPRAAYIYPMVAMGYKGLALSSQFWTILKSSQPLQVPKELSVFC